MTEYRRFYRPGGIYFFTLVTYERQPIFAKPENISLLRLALKQVKSEMPFDFVAAVVLPDHLHFIWQLPEGDSNYSARIGKLKILFTRSLRGQNNLPKNISDSRRKHRESDVWQRRFWEHTIKNEQDFLEHLNYIHYNPVKHNLVNCPHFWSNSSLQKWIEQGLYSADWCCICQNNNLKVSIFAVRIDE
ncbi:MAG: REP-associated tyrosine transposase [Xenococcaceae cyanobacterium]